MDKNFDLVPGVNSLLQSFSRGDKKLEKLFTNFTDHGSDNDEVSVIFHDDRKTYKISAKPGSIKMVEANEVESFAYRSGDIIDGSRKLSGDRLDLFTFTDNAMKGSKYIPSGMTGILSGPRGGKTLLANSLLDRANAKNVPTAKMSLGEPESDQGGTPLMALLGIMTAYARFGNCVLMIDSVREMMLTVGGDTRTGGVKTGLVSFFTSLDRVAAKCGIALIAVVNPSNKLNEDEGRITATDVIKADLESSTGCQIYLESIADISVGRKGNAAGKRLTYGIAHRRSDRRFYMNTEEIFFSAGQDESVLDSFDTILPYTDENNPLGL